MDRFNLYAQYYDLLYRDKDYAAEAAYVDSLIRHQLPHARTLLNMGCGTGRHDQEFARSGYQVTGIDLSAEMIAIANQRAANNSSLTFLQADIRNAALGKTFDVVVSLFHVMSYQVNNHDLAAAISTAANHLQPGGLFIFDCWYGPGVLTDPPVTRIKQMANQHINVTRTAQPFLNDYENWVDVHYNIAIQQQGTTAVTEIAETHRMRYLFAPEIALLTQSNFNLLGAFEWLGMQQPTTQSWNAVFVLQKKA